MSLLVDQLRNKYASTSGRAWKSAADQLYPPSKAVEAFLEIFKADLQSDDGDRNYTVISPSCNSASHEVTIGRRLAQMLPFKSILMLCSDLVIGFSDITSTLQNAIEPNLKFMFKEGDAFYLNRTFPTSLANVIYDHKGALWHAANDGDSSDVKNLLGVYRDTTKRGGIIAYDGKRRGSSADEWSTSQKLARACSKSPVLANFINTTFETKTVGHGLNDLEILVPRIS